jgi:hypothetical protein
MARSAGSIRGPISDPRWAWASSISLSDIPVSRKRHDNLTPVRVRLRLGDAAEAVCVYTRSHLSITTGRYPFEI